MSLDAPLRTAEALRDLLRDELRRAREERRLLAKLDVSRLFARAGERAAFLAEAGRLEQELARQLAASAAALGVRDVTLDAIREAAPVLGTRLAEVLTEVRALARSASDADGLNRDLARRALACVRGYVEALAPVPRAYDRRGTRATALAAGAATVSSKV